MKRILLLGAQHGNEPLGDMLKQHLYHSSRDILPFVTFKTANLRAKRAGVRYIDSDMNRSYGTTSNGYEARRAAHISSYITANNFSLVLDLHTTNCHQPASILTHGLTDEKKSFLQSSTIEKVVDMQHEIVRHSLIGTHENALSIEISNEELGPSVLEGLARDIKRYITREKVTSTKEMYTIKSLLLKSSVPEGAVLENFVKSPLGFIPILTGENSYKKQTNYLGFQAETVRQIKV